MPIIKSAKKRVRVSNKAAVRNAKTKRTMREAIKAFTASVKKGKSSEVASAQAAANKAIDTAAKKHVIHANKAARKKAQLSAAAKAAGVKPAGATKKAAPVKKAAAKPAAKKPTPAAKKPTPAAKKATTAKKSTAKKTAAKS